MAKKHKTSVQKQEAPIPEDKLAYAISLQQQWRFEEAKAQYQALLKETPQDADALHNLGVLFSVQLLEPAEALPYFEAALNLDPTRLQFWYSYLDALIKADALDVAEHVLILASTYGLNDLQITSFTRDIRLARTTIADLVDTVLADAPALPDPQPLAALPASGPEPSMVELQQLLSVFNQKKYDPAIKAITAMLQRFPKAALVWTMLAEVEKRGGFFEKALQARREAAALQPANAETQMALADAWLDLDKQEDAAVILQTILRMQPTYAPALGKMGLIYQSQGEVQKALHSYGWALRHDGLSPLFLEKFGSLLRSQGDQDGALVCFKLAVEASPNVPELLDAYGVTLRNQERLAAAENAFRSALKIHPGYIPALRNLCHLLEFHGRFVEAEAGLLRCAEIENNAPESLFDIGKNLIQQKKESQALEWLQRAIKVKPDYVDAHIMLSVALNASEEPSLALEEVKKSIKVLPYIPHLHTNLGIINLALSRADDAIACFRKALEIDPSFSHARSSMLFALTHSKKITAHDLFREHRIYGKRVEKSIGGKKYSSWRNTKDLDRPLKIGFVSADFYNHAVAQFIIPFFESLAKYEDIISYAYSNHGAVDSYTLEIQKNINVWRTVIQWSDDKLAEKIREDEIDILIDMSGHTGGNRLEVFARHPAPVQVTWLGYPGTTGLRAMDYRFMSESSFEIEKAGGVKLQDQFVEKFVVLPPGAIFKEVDKAIDVGNAPCLNNKYITFGSFNRLNKIDRQVIVGWSQVLKAIPDSQLIMGAMPNNGAPLEITQWFEEEGIDVGRITFYPRVGINDYLKLYAQVDLCLDTFPYTGGTTTNHAVRMGVPTLTVAGNTLASRASSNILHRNGLGKVCVGQSIQDIVDLAILWNKNHRMLNTVRQSLRKSAVENYETQRKIVVEGVVRGLKMMWENWCNGSKPQTLTIEYKDLDVKKPEAFVYEFDSTPQIQI